MRISDNNITVTDRQKEVSHKLVGSKELFKLRMVKCEMRIRLVLQPLLNELNSHQIKSLQTIVLIVSLYWTVLLVTTQVATVWKLFVAIDTTVNMIFLMYPIDVPP